MTSNLIRREGDTEKRSCKNVDRNCSVGDTNQEHMDPPAAERGMG